MKELNEIDRGLRAVIKDEISRMWKNRIGRFTNYSKGDTTFRRVDIELYDIKKTEVPQVQILQNVPLAFYGTQEGIDDFKLTKGAEILVFFCDRSTDDWRNDGGNKPSIVNRKDQHSIDYAIAFPITTFHNKAFTPVDGVKQFKVKEGQKVQIGTDTAELIKILNETLSAFDSLLTSLQKDVDNPSTSSTGTLFKIFADLIQLQTDNTARKTLLDQITQT